MRSKWSATRPAFPWQTDAPRCLTCGGTLSRDEHQHHPGCQPQPAQQETSA